MITVTGSRLIHPTVFTVTSVNCLDLSVRGMLLTDFIVAINGYFCNLKHMALAIIVANFIISTFVVQK